MIFRPFASTILVVSSLVAVTTVSTPVQAYDAGGAAAAAVFGLAAGAMVGAAAAQQPRYYYPAPGYVVYRPAQTHRVDASDWGCEFNDVRRVGDTVTWRGECSFPEEVASATVKASLVGQTLYFRIDDGEALKLERCR